jgi:ketosteroid isomerase-like protein
VEVVRRYYQAANHRDWSLLRKLLDPDLELDLSRNIFNPHVYRGYAGFRRFADAVEDVWDEFSTAPTELIDAGDNVVAAVTMHAKGKQSGVDVTMNLFNVFTLRDSRVLRIVGGYRDRSEALEAAGLSE